VNQEFDRLSRAGSAYLWSLVIANALCVVSAITILYGIYALARATASLIP
jgi:hypothetical protein